jgi:hypothetical protein
MHKQILFWILFGFIQAKSFSQQNYRAGTIPQVNINVSIAGNYKLNTKLESRQIFSEKEPGKNSSGRLRYERTDLALVLTRKLSADNTLGAGYLIRLEDGKFAHRFIQQFNHVKKYETIRMAHRVVLDETFRTDEPTEVRLRYRLGLEKALSGRVVDPKEFYAKFNNEYLGILADKETDLEIRASLALGYNASDENKIELGVEYRINEFNQPVRAQQYWLTMGWFLSI